MGEARLRAEALARHQPLPQDLHRCPKCAGRRTIVEMAQAMAMSHIPTLMGICADCKTVWEAFPPGWKHDVVEGEPCDNCAFAKGSPESQDREEWRSLLAKLRMGQEFKCHKGAPLIIDLETGAAEFDEAWVLRYGRMCAGFLRAMQQWPDWLDNYLTVRHVLTKLDQDKLLALQPEGDTREQA
jgi:hypothetical protein